VCTVGATRRDCGLGDTRVSTCIVKDVVIKLYIVAGSSRVSTVEIDSTASIVWGALTNISQSVISYDPTRRITPVKLDAITLVALKYQVVRDGAV
jgi:hypothetical protein